MGQIIFRNIGIRAISACVPRNIVKTIDQDKYFSKENLEAFINTTAIEERRISDNNTTASDLCLSSANKLIKDLSINKDEIGCLIFMSQTPDFRMPNTACILQNKIGLKKSIFTLDINQACSGYIWGLIAAYSLCNSGFDNVLLCAGDTPSKFLSPNDTSTSLMFGDAGTASLITKDVSFGDSFFSYTLMVVLQKQCLSLMVGIEKCHQLMV